MKAHLDGQRRKFSGNPLHRRDIYNNGDPHRYICRPIASEKKIVRQCCNKSFHIEKQDGSVSPNDRMESGKSVS